MNEGEFNKKFPSLENEGFDVSDQGQKANLLFEDWVIQKNCTDNKIIKEKLFNILHEIGSQYTGLTKDSEYEDGLFACQKMIERVIKVLGLDDE